MSTQIGCSWFSLLASYHFLCRHETWLLLLLWLVQALLAFPLPWNFQHIFPKSTISDSSASPTVPSSTVNSIRYFNWCCNLCIAVVEFGVPSPFFVHTSYMHKVNDHSLIGILFIFHAINRFITVENYQWSFCPLWGILNMILFRFGAVGFWFFDIFDNGFDGRFCIVSLWSIVSSIMDLC